MWRRFQEFNDTLAAHAVLIFGSMISFYILFFYGFLPLVFPQEQNTILYWSNSIQLWSLPLIMVGTNVLGRATEAQAKRQYAMVERMNQLTDQMHTMLESQDVMVSTLLAIAHSNREAISVLANKTDEIDREVDAITEHGNITVIHPNEGDSS